ncbi:MAG: class I SAM-dependent methyltransferase [Prevotellaceae bacterium]|jgi:ubiquinone/menaquinone biosynthesis C-methylase UbiE|nr:class I SAM-dependent methyltransferase [Prevotellaceae bacterium]
MNEITKNCPVCNSPNICLFTNTYDKHYGHSDKNYDAYICKNCNLIFLNPMITDEELFVLYPEDYYDTDKIDVNNIIKRNKFASFKNLLLGNKPKDIRKSFKGKNILDIGVGNCEQLYIFHKKGANAYGTEIRESACKIGEKLGMKISKGTLLDANYPTDFFDYIRSNHSFEHMTNPKEILSEINRILKPDGTLFIGVPNTKSWTFKLFKQNWYHLTIPFHPFSYNKSNLIMLAKQYGFKVEKIAYNASWVSFVGGIQIILNLKNKKKSNDGWFWNKFNKVVFHQIARLSNVFHRGDCIEITFTKESQPEKHKGKKE